MRITATALIRGTQYVVEIDNKVYDGRPEQAAKEVKLAISELENSELAIKKAITH
ncbi:hypothetical protein LCGC14_0591320 [marine sediment metagenome]|uniref:Uncharacterized protein n=1 Tax=marine sediment metagenome TaxID=412755 RepID=A0A0F9RDB4_9ZZZZ